MIEELPHMLSSMALLWGVVKREESQSRGSDYSQTARHTSTSVYFKSSKVFMCVCSCVCVHSYGQ